MSGGVDRAGLRLGLLLASIQVWKALDLYGWTTWSLNTELRKDCYSRYLIRLILRLAEERSVLGALYASLAICN